jgi:hypothetical protein
MAAETPTIQARPPEATPSGNVAIATVIRVLMVFDTIALLFAGIIHFGGVRIPLGFAVFDEPALLPAAVVETLAGLIFLASAFGVFMRRSWAWSSAAFAHAFAILGFVVGIVATRNGTTQFNHTYHLVMLVLFVVGLILLLLPPARASLGRVQH